MMCRLKKALVVRHVPHEGLGTMKRPLEAGFRAEYLDVYKGDRIPREASGYSGLIVLGGPMGVYEEEKFPFITGELRLIESALKARVPVLGVCLGSQLLAKAAGARVYKGKSKEIGWYRVQLTEEGVDDRLFQGLPDDFTVFQWHGDTFDVPAGGVNLLSSELFPNQVIKVAPNAYGIQFHLEVTEAMIREWIGVNAGELISLKGKIDPKRILEETPGNIAELHKLGSTVISRFLRMIDN